MRTLIVLLLLAVGFAAAALWQSQHLEELHAKQQEAWEVSDGESAETASGRIREGWATVIVGAPSGVEPLVFEQALPDTEPRSDSAGERRAAWSEAQPAPFPPDTVTPDTPETYELGDFELEVQPGQTLSGIAHTHYGSASANLVRALADYNGLEDADDLRSGAWVLLPELDRLLPEGPGPEEQDEAAE